MPAKASFKKRSTSASWRLTTIGGTLHVVVNNQIGFTTGPSEGRSTTYATDVAKMLQIPIFHVNGEDPEAVAQVVRLAMDFRREFQRDVVIDMYCYRRRGHNEGDEPAFTQPLLYQAIDERKSVREGYLDHLLKLGGIDRESRRSHCGGNAQHASTRNCPSPEARSSCQRPDLASVWAFYIGGREREAAEVETDIEREQLVELLGKLARSCRPDFSRIRKSTRFLEARREMAARQTPARLVGRRSAWPSAVWRCKNCACGSAGRIRSAARSAIGTPCCTT